MLFVVISVKTGIQSMDTRELDGYMMAMFFPVGSAFMSIRRNIPRHEECVKTGCLFAEDNRCSGFLPAQELPENGFVSLTPPKLRLIPYW